MKYKRLQNLHPRASPSYLSIPVLPIPFKKGLPAISAGLFH